MLTYKTVVYMQVPSPVNSMDSSNQGLYSPTHPSSAGIFNTEFVTISNGVLQVTNFWHC